MAKMVSIFYLELLQIKFSLKWHTWSNWRIDIGPVVQNLYVQL